MITYKDLHLTKDKVKLLYILSKYSVYDETNGKIIWAKELTILAAIFRVLRYDLPVQQQILTIKYSQKDESEKHKEIESLQTNKIFESYRFTPTYRVYHGNYRLMNICVDALEDMAEMVRKGLIQKFKIGTAKFTFENSFIITATGSQVLKECASDDDQEAKMWKSVIDNRLGCTECHGSADIVLLEDKIGFLCNKYKWKHFDPSLIFIMQDIEYTSEQFRIFNEKEEE
jgi:hypothetical protein